jgi:hypothetical protein
MFSTGKNGVSIYLRALTLLCAVVMGWLFLYNCNVVQSHSPANKPQIEISVNQSSATISSGIQIQFFQIQWILNKDNFRLLSFETTGYLDNRKTDHVIGLLENIRDNISFVHNSFLHYYLNHYERNEPPLLA